MDAFYRDIILDHFKHPRNFGRLDHPDASWELRNVLCGDVIGMEILCGSPSDSDSDRVISDIRFFGEGCAISFASASLLTDTVKGKPLSFVRSLTREDIVHLLGVDLTPTRLKCALLPLEVLQKAAVLVKEKGNAV